jgi:hypothetical protein
LNHQIRLKNSRKIAVRRRRRADLSDNPPAIPKISLQSQVFSRARTTSNPRLNAPVCRAYSSELARLKGGGDPDERQRPPFLLIAAKKPGLDRRPHAVGARNQFHADNKQATGQSQARSCQDLTQGFRSPLAAQAKRLFEPFGSDTAAAPRVAPLRRGVAVTP